jgi:hypothetical protein
VLASGAELAGNAELGRRHTEDGCGGSTGEGAHRGRVGGAWRSQVSSSATQS